MAKGYKWWRMVHLKRDSSIADHLPATSPLTESHLANMLDRYGQVIVKPTSGSGGMGVIQVTRGKSGDYYAHRDASRIKIADSSGLYAKIKRWTGGRSCMVQKRIALGEIHGRPFDVRVMVQRGKTSGWTITGKLAKIAGPGYIVTNIQRSRGRVTTVDAAVRGANLPVPAGEIHARLDRIALQTARRLGPKYAYQRVFGIDMGIDRQGKVWIIEANFAPSVSLFRRLKDKTAYHRILKYRRS